jgi:protein TonB
MNRRSGTRAALPVCIGFFLTFGGLSPAEEPLLRISELDARKAAVKKVEPEYPAMARQVRLSGRVQVDVIIGSAGNVEKVNVVRGNVLLSNSAASALKRWKFTPFMGVDNKPAKAIASLTFDFHLQPGL